MRSPDTRIHFYFWILALTTNCMPFDLRNQVLGEQELWALSPTARSR